MVSALGVNQAWLFTAVFALGTFLGGLGGALQLPKEAATLDLDINMIGAAFVVVVVGGMGSLPGAYLAALLIAEVKAVCIWLGVVDMMGMTISFSKLTLVVEFLVMAIVLIRRPWGLLGRPQAPSRHIGQQEEPLRRGGRAYAASVCLFLAALVILPLMVGNQSYAVVLAIDLMIAALFAASLHFIMGPGGMHSFGHAAYFGLGAYGAALLAREGSRLFGLPMEAALVLAPFVAGMGALLFGWFAVRLSGVYLAMLTLAFAQITWAIVFQWDSFTGGSNGMSGVWPSPWLADKRVYYGVTLVLVVLALGLLRRMLFSPFGFALRAGRDSPLRADAIGIDVKRLQWVAFAIAGTAAGLAGALFAFSKGSISPEALSSTRSVDGLVMVLLGGLQTLTGPIIGAVAFNWLHDTAVRNTEYWRTVIGGTILLLVLLFPQGIVGGLRQLLERLGGRWSSSVKEGDNPAAKTRVRGAAG
jgi:branched-chain amino acid transport system permease protein